MPLLTSPGVDNSVAIFFGDSYTDSTLYGLASLFRYKKEIKPLENRTVIFQDIDMHAPHGDNYNVLEMFYRRRQHLHELQSQDEQRVMMLDYVRRLLRILSWDALNHNPEDRIYSLLPQVYSESTNILKRQYTLPLLEYTFEEVSVNTNDKAHQYWKNASFAELKCPSTKCLPGFQPKYGLVNSPHTLLDEEHRTRCELCPENTIKLGTGDGSCTPCTGVLSVDNGKRTACIDPYTNKPLLFDDEQRVILCTSSGLGCVL
eukprot:TCONS_00049733-protein